MTAVRGAKEWRFWGVPVTRRWNCVTDDVFLYRFRAVRNSIEGVFRAVGQGCCRVRPYTVHRRNFKRVANVLFDVPHSSPSRISAQALHELTSHPLPHYFSYYFAQALPLFRSIDRVKSCLLLRCETENNSTVWLHPGVDSPVDMSCDPYL